MSSQSQINIQLTKGVSYSIVLPVLASKKVDIDHVATRTWLVPGEKAVVYIVTTPSLSPLEAFSCYCTVTNSEYTAHTEQVANRLQVASVSVKEETPDMEPFRLPDNRMVFPVRIQVPVIQSRGFFISVFCLRNTNPEPNPLQCFCMQPFSVHWKKFLTPQSVIIQFEISCVLPEEWSDPIKITSADLKFSEKASDESELTSSIAIIRSAETSCDLLDRDCVSVAFSLKPLSDIGAMKIAKIPLVFRVTWKAGEKEITSSFPLNVGEETADLVISAPMIKCELLKPSVMPLRITNMRKGVRKALLCFGSGRIQPMMKNCEIVFEDGEEAKSIEFGFIPLSVGEHQLKIWAEEDGKTVEPMFPICISVHKPE